LRTEIFVKADDNDNDKHVLDFCRWG